MNRTPQEMRPEFDVISNTRATTAGSWTRILDNDPMRVAILVGNSQGYGLWPVPIGASNGGITVASSLPPFIMTFATHGALVQGEWYVFAIGVITPHIASVRWSPKR